MTNRTILKIQSFYHPGGNMLRWHKKFVRKPQEQDVGKTGEKNSQRWRLRVTLFFMSMPKKGPTRIIIRRKAGKAGQKKAAADFWRFIFVVLHLPGWFFCIFYKPGHAHPAAQPPSRPATTPPEGRCCALCFYCHQVELAFNVAAEIS